MRTLLAALLLIPAWGHADKPRTHDGFQLALGLGPTVAFNGGLYKNADGDEVLITAEGVGIGGMILAGHTVAEGLVVGGGTMGGHAFSPTGRTEIVDSDEDAVERNLDSDLVFNLVGPYVDYYANENDGLHGMFLAGFATIEDGDDRTDGLALGWGLLLGVGYDWSIADQWSLGVLARMHVLFTGHEIEVDGDTVDIDYGVVAASVMMTTVWH